MPAQLIKTIILVILASLLSTTVLAQDEDSDTDFIDIPQESSGAEDISDKLFKKNNASVATTSASLTNLGTEIEVQELDGAVVSENIAVLRIIDKTLGKLYLLDLEVGTKKAINELSIKANACLHPGQKLIIPEGRAQVEVFETRNRVVDKIFSGWIYAQSPSASYLSHPKYDITLAGCKAGKLQE